MEPVVLQIGKDVWIKDENQREYVLGRSNPVYRKHFRRVQIVGETSRSWLLESPSYDQLKLDKKTLMLRPPGGQYGLSAQVWLSEQAVEDDIFMQDKRGEVSRAVLACRDATAFREIVAVLVKHGQLVIREV